MVPKNDLRKRFDAGTGQNVITTDKKLFAFLRDFCGFFSDASFRPLKYVRFDVNVYFVAMKLIAEDEKEREK